MKRLVQELEKRLETIRQNNLYRQLAEPQGIDFCSNDYLGLSSQPLFREKILARLNDLGARPMFAPSSRLLRGQTAGHRELESRLAAFKNAEAALIFPSGYQANIGLLATLVRPEDRVLSDERNHASIIDALRLSRCQKKIYPHLDFQSVERELQIPNPGGNTFLVTESLFSMDGDIAPLDRYAELAELYGAALVVDDAHATGIFGEQRGSGLVEHFAVESKVLAIVSTFGKALGLCGAFVAAPATVIDYLINCSRSFIFTTAVPPLLLAGIEAALELCSSQPVLRQRVLKRAERFRSRLRAEGFGTFPGVGPIVPVRVGENETALEIAAKLQERGFDVRAIRPPTVAPGSSRLRVSIHADHTEEQIDSLAAALAEVFTEMSVLRSR